MVVPLGHNLPPQAMLQILCLLASPWSIPEYLCSWMELVPKLSKRGKQPSDSVTHTEACDLLSAVTITCFIQSCPCLGPMLGAKMGCAGLHWLHTDTHQAAVSLPSSAGGMRKKLKLNTTTQHNPIRAAMGKINSIPARLNKCKENNKSKQGQQQRCLFSYHWKAQ